MAVTIKYHVLDGNRHLSLPVLEARKSEIRVPTSLSSGESSLSDLQMVDFLQYLHPAHKETLVSLSPLIRVLTPP